jgi:hypothetical protein
MREGVLNRGIPTPRTQLFIVSQRHRLLVNGLVVTALVVNETCVEEINGADLVGSHARRRQAWGLIPENDCPGSRLIRRG